jgi:hypothetical protein
VNKITEILLILNSLTFLSLSLSINDKATNYISDEKENFEENPIKNLLTILAFFEIFLYLVNIKF